MLTLVRRLLLLGTLCLSLSALADDALRLGIMPFNSALALVRTHQPLRQALAASLGRPVEVYTAADYPSFVRETLAGNYDLLITGPHFAVMSIDKGYIPLVHYKAPLQPVFVVRRDATMATPAQLRGKRIALSSRFSISSIGGIKWLADQGLQAGRDFQVIEMPTHGAAVAAVAVGEADAALTTHTPLHQVPADVREQVRILPSEIRVPHLMTLVHQRLGAPTVAAVRRALADFAASEAGRRFFEETGYQGYDPVSDEDVRALRPYVAIVRRELEQAGP